MCPAIVCGIAVGDASVSYWSIFSLSPVTVLIIVIVNSA